METAVYPRERPWRVFYRVQFGEPFASRGAKIVLLCGPLLILWAVSMAGILGEGRIFPYALWAGALSLAGFIALWLPLRLREMRATYLTHPGIELPAELTIHPMVRPTLITFIAAVDVLIALPVIHRANAPASHWVLGGLVVANLLALPLYRWIAEKLRLRVENAALHSRGQPALNFSAIEHVTWRAGRTGGEPDRLELSGGGMTIRLSGWHDRSDDHIRNLLRLILQPRLETARTQFRRAGFLACGPLRVYPDHFSRPDDTPPLKLPFALARSAHIDDAGRLAVEIEGRHEPLVLLGPDEYPLTPLVLRLISELWTVPAPPEENPAAEVAGAESGEETEWVN
jgi:hypothetical protein